MDKHRELVHRKLVELSDVKQKKKKQPVFNENQDEDIIRAQINRVLSGPKHIVNMTMIVLNIIGILLCICQLFNRCLNYDYLFLLTYFLLALAPQIFLVMRKRFPSKLIAVAYTMYATFYLGGAALIILFFVESIQSILCKYEVCHQFYGGHWIKNNFRESALLCEEQDLTKAKLRNEIITLLTEYQDYPTSPKYNLDNIALLNFTSIYVVFSILILAKIVYAVYLIIYFILIFKYKKKHPQLFKKINKDINNDILQSNSMLESLGRNLS